MPGVLAFVTIVVARLDHVRAEQVLLDPVAHFHNPRRGC